MPITAISMFIGSICMFVSWLFINHRINTSQQSNASQPRLLANFVLYMSIFFLFLFVPHLLLVSRPDEFPLLVATGYTIGHIFTYLGLIQLLKLHCSLVPRLQSKESMLVGIGTVFAALVTILTARTMIWGTLPEYDTQHNVTLFHANPVVGASIGLMAITMGIPPALLFLRNGLFGDSARMRSLLLGSGLLTIMLAGPLHDVAPSATVYVIADIFTVAGIVLTTAGVTYKIRERMSISREAPANP